MGLLEIHGLQKKFALSTAVEHFELDGWAVLRLDIEPAP